MDGKLGIVILLLAVGWTHQLMQPDTSESDNVEADSIIAETTIKAETTIQAETTTVVSLVTETPKNCSTAKKLEGVCVARQYCEFATNAIDFTLFATRGYVSVCKLGEVCCPHKYVVAVEQSYQTDDNFGFDDDD